MSAEKLIAELHDRGLISDRLLAKLRETVVESARPLSASALAKFLVQKKHLSQAQAAEVLRALSNRGIDADSVGENIHSSPTNDDESENEPEGSSIFAPFLTGAGKKTSEESRRQSDDEDELTLVSIDDEDTTISRKKSAPEEVDDDLPVLGALTTSKNPAPRTKPVPPATDRQPTRDLEESAPLALTESDVVDPEPADADELPTPRRTASLKRPAKGKSAKRKAKPTIRKKEWDSPLILYGGGGLALMILVGAAVAWFLTKEKGDLELTQARAALDSGAYSQAIEHYESFLTDSPRHPEVSSARVQLAMVRIRQTTESANYSASLELAQKELEAIEDEKEFDKAQAELTALLPQIALGLAKQAEKAGAGAEEAKHLVEQSKTALELCNNVAYIPQKQRDEGQLNVVREILNRVEYRELSHQALQETLTAMQQAADSGKTTVAYAAHKQLVKKHPELAGNAKLAEMIQKTTAAEHAAVKFVREEQGAETNEPPTPWVASLALAQRRGSAAAVPPVASTAFACVRVDGAVYGIDVATGSLRWRRHVGYASAAWPVAVDRDVLVTDARKYELLRLDAATGQLVWRQAIGEPFAAPLVVGGRAFLAAESGRLYVVDLASGARAGYLQFEQALNVAPAADRRQERLYLTGEHFSLYSISLADLTCLGVYYLGHDTGSIQFAPAQVLNKLAVIVNDGVETSRLHLLTIDDRGAVGGQATSQRLQGLAASPLMVEGRRLIVVTDRGRFDVYEIGAGQGNDSLAQLATRPATDQQPIVRYVSVADGHIWVGDTQLTKYAILPTGDRLPVVSIGNNFAGSAFDHPLEVFGNTLIHVRRPKGRAGYVVAATDARDGRSLWETDLAVPPAGAPIVDVANKSLTVANANGYLFRFDETAIRSRVVDEPLPAHSMPSKLTPLSAGVDLGDGRAAFFAPNSKQVLFYDPAKGGGKWIELESPLACSATSFGDGLLAPLKLGQVFYLDPTSGKSIATPFQPKLQPRTTVDYQPAGAVDDRRFVIADGQEKIYLVNRVDEPQPHLDGIAEAKVSPYRIVSPIVVVGDLVMAATEGAHVARFRLPALEPAGEADLPGELAWGPFRVGQQVVLATADGKLVGLSATGDIAWTEPLRHGDLAGPPLATDVGIVLAYRNGIIERRNMADGKPAAERDLEHPVASGPVQFLSRIVLAAHDGTLLVVDQP